jgi:PIN domain nuclease of toxin-antitoxin system
MVVFALFFGSEGAWAGAQALNRAISPDQSAARPYSKQRAIIAVEVETEVPMSADMALAASELPEPFHKDPADRLIVAMARLLNAPVVTVDRRILGFGRRGQVEVPTY